MITQSFWPQRVSFLTPQSFMLAPLSPHSPNHWAAPSKTQWHCNRTQVSFTGQSNKMASNCFLETHWWPFLTHCRILSEIVVNQFSQHTFVCWFFSSCNIPVCIQLLQHTCVYSALATHLCVFSSCNTPVCIQLLQHTCVHRGKLNNQFALNQCEKNCQIVQSASN